MTDSEIKITRGATTFAGPDAVELFRAMTLRQALGLLKVGITPTRGLTQKKALALVERYSGRTYKRSQIDLAIADLTTWIEAMKSAMPVTREDAQ